MGIVVRLPFVPSKQRPSCLRRSGRDITAAFKVDTNSIYQRRPLRLRRSGRDIIAGLVSTNYLFFYMLSVLGGTGTGTGHYLVELGH